MAGIYKRYFLGFMLLLVVIICSVYLAKDYIEQLRTLKEYQETQKIKAKPENSYKPQKNVSLTKKKAAASEKSFDNNDISQRMQERLSLLRTRCDKHDLPTGGLKKMARFILVNDQYKILYCKIPKVGCSNWVKLLLMLQGHTKEDLNVDVHKKLVYEIKTLQSYSPKEIEYRLKHYLKFMFVRNPWDRLVSIFVDKMENNSENSPGYRSWPEAVKLREKYSVNNEHRTADFDGFLRFMLEEKGAMNFDPIMYATNIHWVQYYKICYPCAINYDIIGKMETLNEDVEYTLKKANISIPYPSRLRKHEGKTSTKTEKYY